MNDLNHVAIIMDGNGRWAKKRNKARTFGHTEGVKRVRDIAIHAKELGIKCLTLYAFSTENWKRSEKEVNHIMSLPKVFFKSYLKELMENDIRVEMLGSHDRIPLEADNIFKDAIEKTKNNKTMILNFAVNYGGRDEIVNACKKYGEDLLNGKQIDLNEETFKDYLYTKGLPEIDLMIRTSKEYRISNFLLYQLAYSEMIFVDVLWPDFYPEEFDKCIEEYNKRKRNFGGIEDEKSN